MFISVPGLIQATWFLSSLLEVIVLLSIAMIKSPCLIPAPKAGPVSSNPVTSDHSIKTPLPLSSNLIRSSTITPM